jgi:hypothetical protein
VGRVLAALGIAAQSPSRAPERARSGPRGQRRAGGRTPSR